MHDDANDVGRHFTDLFDLLARAESQRDFEGADLTAAVIRGATTAREAGVRPERVLAYLRGRAHEAALPDVGDWYRGVLADRLVARAIEAYFTDTDGAGPLDE